MRHVHERCGEVLHPEEEEIPQQILSLLRCSVGVPAFYYGSELAEITGLRRAEQSEHSVRRANADLGLRYIARHGLASGSVLLTATRDWSPAAASWELVWEQVEAGEEDGASDAGIARQVLSWSAVSRRRRARQIEERGEHILAHVQSSLEALEAGVHESDRKLWESIEEGVRGRGGLPILEWAGAAALWKELGADQQAVICGLAASWQGPIAELAAASAAVIAGSA